MTIDELIRLAGHDAPLDIRAAGIVQQALALKPLLKAAMAAPLRPLTLRHGHVHIIRAVAPAVPDVDDGDWLQPHLIRSVERVDGIGDLVEWVMETEALTASGAVGGVLPMSRAVLLLPLLDKRVADDVRLAAAAHAAETQTPQESAAWSQALGGSKAGGEGAILDPNDDLFADDTQEK